MAEVHPRDVLLRFGGRALDQGVLFMPGPGRGPVDVKETFTRSSVGYFLDRDGIIRKASNDKIRDYWPLPALFDAFGRRLHGPLIESARTNGWATVTEDYANAAWTKNGCTITSNTHVAPDGVLASADKIVESAVNEEHYIARNIAGMTDNTRTSVWWLVKAAERIWCRIRTFSKAGTDRSTFFNLSTGALGTKSADHDAWIRPLGTSLGYYFIAVSFDAGTGGGTPHARVQLALNDNGGAYAGDGSSGIYAWESGVEVDKPFPSYPGSILPNGLARVADLPLVPFNFGPSDLSVAAWLDRPMHVDATGNLGVAPGIFDLGNQTNPYIRSFFESAIRSLSSQLITGSGNSLSPTTAYGAGAQLKFLTQFKDAGTTPAIAVDVGSGLGSFGTGAAPFSAYGSQALRIGRVLTSELNGVIFDVSFIRGLRTHAEAFAAAV